MLQAGRSRVRDPMRWMNFISIYLILLAALGPGLYSASNRNEYQEQKNNVSGEWSVAGAWGRQTYCHLSANCLDNVGLLTSLTTLQASMACYGDSFNFLLFLLHIYVYLINKIWPFLKLQSFSTLGMCERPRQIMNWYFFGGQILGTTSMGCLSANLTFTFLWYTYCHCLAIKSC
jgi:hypothetical protein